MKYSRARAVLGAALSIAAFARTPELTSVAAQETKATTPSSEKAGLPLKTERKIAFETDEGTWVSLDVAPDGKTIVFELAGELYTLPMAGGKASPLSTGLAFDSQPRYSPDGAHVAFLSDRDGADNLWIMKADGSGARQITKEKQASFASPAWTEDGQSVIVSKNTPGLRTFELWVYDTRGGSGIQITKAKPRPETTPAEQHNALGVAVSKEGRYLYYATKRGGFAYNVTFPLWQIARKDR
ncbi:MAG: PD40 domain-containing protein, partial [Vicinamibacteria bacterium]|nr:PD40 domain-containing protein [Vicinamibacteria bacterium]